MKPTRFSLILTNGANTIRLVQTGKNNLDLHTEPEGVLIAMGVVVHPHHSILILVVVVFLTSLRHFLDVLTLWGAGRVGVCAMICEDVQGIILNSLLR